MKKITVRLAGLAALLVLTIGTSFAVPSMSCCEHGQQMACCNHGQQMACCNHGQQMACCSHFSRK